MGIWPTQYGIYHELEYSQHYDCLFVSENGVFVPYGSKENMMVMS